MDMEEAGDAHGDTGTEWNQFLKPLVMGDMDDIDIL